MVDEVADGQVMGDSRVRYSLVLSRVGFLAGRNSFRCLVTGKRACGVKLAGGSASCLG